MIKRVGWATSIAFLFWQTIAAEPLLPPLVSALLLLLVGVLMGLRIAADASAEYIADLQRLNKVLSEQQQGLEEANLLLLKRANAAAAAPSEGCRGTDAENTLADHTKLKDEAGERTSPQHSPDAA